MAFGPGVGEEKEGRGRCQLHSDLPFTASKRDESGASLEQFRRHCPTRRPPSCYSRFPWLMSISRILRLGPNWHTQSEERGGQDPALGGFEACLYIAESARVLCSRCRAKYWNWGAGGPWATAGFFSPTQTTTFSVPLINPPHPSPRPVGAAASKTACPCLDAATCLPLARHIEGRHIYHPSPPRQASLSQSHACLPFLHNLLLSTRRVFAVMSGCKGDKLGSNVGGEWKRGQPPCHTRCVTMGVVVRTEHMLTACFPFPDVCVPFNIGGRWICYYCKRKL